MNDTKQTKVAFLLPNLGAGGAERVVTILSQALVKEGIAVDILLLLTGKMQYRVPEGVQTVSLETKNLSKVQRFQKLRAYFKEQKKLHPRFLAIAFQDNCLQYALAAGVGLGISVIACERNDPNQKGTGFPARLRANLPYVLADKCVFQTPDARDYYCGAVRKKASVIANPLNLQEDLRWQGCDSRTILAVGRLEPQKNQKMLIAAFAQLHKRFPDHILEIYGEGSLARELQQQILDLGLQNSVFLRGYAENIPQKMTQAAMFVMPSDYEGMSNALMEALAIGVPVVTTDHPIGSAAMLVENGISGILTPVGDTQAFASAMEQLLSHRDTACRLGHHAMQIRSRLAVGTIVRQWLDIINT